MDQTTTFELLRAAQQDVQSPASSEFPFPAALQPSYHGFICTHTANPAVTLLTNNIFKEFSRSYFMYFMSFSVQMCKAKQAELWNRVYVRQ